MVKLLIDTSTSNGFLALLDKNFLSLDFIQWDKSKRHNEILITNLEELLSRNSLSNKDITSIFIGQGPGSFTGLRVSFSLAKTLSFVNKNNIFSFPSPRLFSKDLIIDKNSPQEWTFLTPSVGGRYFQTKYKKKCEDYITEGLPNNSVELTENKNLFSLVEGPNTKVLNFKIEKSTDFSYLFKRFILCSGSYLDQLPLYLRLSEAEEKLRKK